MFKQIKASCFNGSMRYGKVIRLAVPDNVKQRQLNIYIPAEIYEDSKILDRACVYIDEANCMMLITPSDCCGADSSDGSYKVQGKIQKSICIKNPLFPTKYNAVCDHEIRPNGAVLITYPDPKTYNQEPRRKSFADMIA